MNKLIKSACFIITCCMLSTNAVSIQTFSYDLSVQTETSLDQGEFEIYGKVFNSGSMIIDLSPQAGWIGGFFDGINSSCTIGDALDCIFDNLNGKTLSPGETIEFNWISGDIDRDLSNRAGEKAWFGLLFVPLGSDWSWNSVPVPDPAFSLEPRVETMWVNGGAEQGFDTETFDLATFGQYIDQPTAVNESPASWLIFSFIAFILSIRFCRKLDFRTNVTPAS